MKEQDIKVLDSTMHWVEAGQGKPIVFIHGVPTHAYLWRNIIPSLSQIGRCIAVDLIGMGQSGKPDSDYRIFDHIRYFDAFMEALGLEDVTLVLHGWGSVVGFDYARRHSDKIKGIAFFESHIRPTLEWEMLSLPVQQLASLLQRPGASYRAIVSQNYLIEKLLPSGVVRPLTEEEMEAYRAPFKTEGSRRVLWQYLQDLPLGAGPDDVVDLINQYSDWLQQTPIPKLMLYAVPGFITTIDTVRWAKEHLSQLELVAMDDVLHFAQESVPELFSEVLHEWYVNIGVTA